MLGIAALKECPVKVWFLSVKSHRIFLSHELIFCLVRNFPFLKVKTGLSDFQTPSAKASFLSLFSEATGQNLQLVTGYKSIIFPLNPVDLLYGMKIKTSPSLENTTFFHVKVTPGSKLFSNGATISPILHKEKKLIRHAVQKTCLE